MSLLYLNARVAIEHYKGRVCESAQQKTNTKIDLYRIDLLKVHRRTKVVCVVKRTYQSNLVRSTKLVFLKHVTLVVAVTLNS